MNKMSRINTILLALTALASALAIADQRSTLNHGNSALAGGSTRISRSFR